MRILILQLLVLVLTVGSVRGQSIEQILQEVNLDSLLFNAQSLTGILPITVNGQTAKIPSRHKDELGNEWAGIYLKNRLEHYGYTVNQQIFSSKGKNYYAIKQGTTYPERAYMICAHYDAIAIPFSSALGADDNASGCAAVLEAARILKNYDFPYSIIFAFWDEEEQGLIGSEGFTQQFDFDQTNIEAVINLDMIANDRNNDMRAELHTQDFGNSLELVQRMIPLNDTFSIGLDLETRNPGTSASDHAAFWDVGVTAILLIEDKQDFNPYYHTKYDSTKYFNDSFFYRNATFAIASLSWLASQEDFRLSAQTLENSTISWFPNPSTGTLHFDKKEALDIQVISQHGKLVYNKHLPASESDIDLQGLSPGFYSLIIKTETGRLQRNSLILR